MNARVRNVAEAKYQATVVVATGASEPRQSSRDWEDDRDVSREAVISVDVDVTAVVDVKREES